MPGADALFAGIHHDERTCAVSVLYHARLKARLSEECCLLVSSDACYGDSLSCEEIAAGVAEDTAGWQNIG